MTDCLVCGASGVDVLLDFGPQPVTSHYMTSPRDEPERHRLVLAVCSSCGMSQLAPPFPPAALVPPYDWITYREPEDHLDAVVDRARALAQGGGIATVGGISYKDATTIARLSRKGAGRTWVVDPWDDLGAENPNANIETVHERLTPDTARAIVEHHGRADVLVARHIAEHAGAPARFMRALEAMLEPGGVLVIEAPDCGRNLSLQDYTMMWEDHSLYPTAQTLPTILSNTSLVTVDVEVYPYPFENVLVLYARKGDAGEGRHVPVPADAADRSRAEAVAYAGAFECRTEEVRAILSRLRERGPMALYGAGHLACVFVNLHGVADLFEFVVDDTPQKQGLYMPGSAMPIVPRTALAASNVATCLFALAPEIEDKVIANNAAFVERGGAFHSIFAASSRSIRRLADIA